MKLSQLAATLGAALDGDGSIEINGVAGIEDALPGQLTFVANPKYTPLAQTTQASAVLVAPDFPANPRATLRVANPYLAFARAVGLFYQPPHYPAGIHPTASISKTAKLGENAHVGPYVVVMDGACIGNDAVLLAHVVVYPGVEIGDRFYAHAHSVVREHCRIGNNVILQNGAVVGSDGFGFAKDEEGRWQKILQSGPVIVEDDVEIQAGAIVDRASVGSTIIRRGAKIDNLTQVGHGSTVGEDTLLCAQVGLAGSTKVGRNVILAGQVGVAGHCHIGDGVVAYGQSGLHGDIPAGKTVSGSPAFDSRQWLRATAIFSRLPELLKQLSRKS